jgi:DNA adenine methylase
MFGVSRDNPARFNLTTLGQDLAAIHERLASVIIECLPYDDLIARYDGPNVLFYLDPPYWGCEADYGKGVFTRADFRVLARRLSAIEGICLLSINDVPEIRAIFDGFEMLTVETHYSIGGGKGTPAAELIISNRPIPPGLIQMPDDQRDLF